VDAWETISPAFDSPKWGPYRHADGWNTRTAEFTDGDLCDLTE